MTYMCVSQTAQASARGIRPSLGEFTAEHFLPHVGRTLTFLQPADERGNPGAPVEFRLIAVDALATARGAGRSPFSLLFLSVNGETLARGLPRLVDPGFEPCELFLSRVLPPAGLPAGVYYEAVFN